ISRRKPAWQGPGKPLPSPAFDRTCNKSNPEGCAMQTADVREQMIEQQVRAWDVLDERVLDVMRQVPRELFVPAGYGYLAYADLEVPLPRGQHMLRPSVAGRLLQALLPAPDEPVLEIVAVPGSLPHYDARFERLLSVGGRLFVVVGEAPVMEARLVRRTAEDAWATQSLYETVIDPLVSAARPPRFTF